VEIRREKWFFLLFKKLLGKKGRLFGGIYAENEQQKAPKLDHPHYVAPLSRNPCHLFIIYFTSTSLS